MLFRSVRLSRTPTSAGKHVRVRFLRARVTLGLNSPRMRIKKKKSSNHLFYVQAFGKCEGAFLTRTCDPGAE